MGVAKWDRGRAQLGLWWVGVARLRGRGQLNGGGSARVGGGANRTGQSGFDEGRVGWGGVAAGVGVRLS